MRLGAIGLIVVFGATLTACSDSSGKSAATLPPISEPETTVAPSTIPSSTPPATSWTFHVTSPEGWEYDVSASSDMQLQFGKDTTLSRPGMARLTVAGSGSLQLQFTNTLVDKTPPAITINQLHITWPDGFITGQHCGADGQPLCVPVLTKENSADQDAAEVDAVLKARTGAPYYFEVRPLATVCVFSLYPDGTVRPLEEFGASPCAFTGDKVVHGS